jgi:hypothetical protein
VLDESAEAALVVALVGELDGVIGHEGTSNG